MRRLLFPRWLAPRWLAPRWLAPRWLAPRWLAPRWLGLHAATLVIVVAFTLLGLWQWDTGRGSQGTLRNLAYGLQWWVFAGFTAFMWWRMLRAELTPADPDDVDPPARWTRPAVPRYQPPASDAAPGDGGSDDDLAAYNRFLADLHQRTGGGTRA